MQVTRIPKRLQNQPGLSGPNIVYVGQGTRFHTAFNALAGDPQSVIRMGLAATETEALARAITTYHRWLTGKVHYDDLPGAWQLSDERRTWILTRIRGLVGKDLACWCPEGQPCHADVLLKLAKIIVAAERGRRRAACLAARAQHRIEGIPAFVSGRTSPSGCAVKKCGRDPRHHGDGAQEGVAPHGFQPLLGPGQDVEDHGRAQAMILRRMRQRRQERALWHQGRGQYPCTVCHVSPDQHPDQHEVTIYADDPWSPLQVWERDQHIIGPYEAPNQEQVLKYMTNRRRHRWDFLDDYEEYSDPGLEAEMDTIRAQSLFDDLDAWKYETP
ncbi:DUF4326 domain-containing protein [Nocardiopsis synnemataformans]|uniref:DUF4326 domain-containing protein n=1 Tax=Nocardiopsis synnemataformans TaxID=61305 RepID=UPI003EBDC757